MNPKKRVISNTIFLYVKMLISMLIALYSTRIVLDSLGVDDFGIYNLIAGIIAMLSFLNVSMTVSTQRYLSFYIGANNSSKLNSVFISSVILHFIIGIIVVILIEFAGIFLFDGILNITQERIPAAKLLYHFMAISTFFTINAVPYDATIVAHEKLLFESLLGIFESIMKLFIAISLTFTHYDRLIVYGALTAGLIILIRLIKSFYCRKKFPECSFKLIKPLDFSFLKEMFSFAGWNTLGAITIMLRNQGTAIIMNIFYGTAINAAYGIANQVNAQVNAFALNMLKSLNPQIVKSEGGGNRQRLHRLTFIASKFSFFLMAIFAIPLIVEMPYVLKLWLKEVPEHTITFCRLMLLLGLIGQLSSGLKTAIQAKGDIRQYAIFINTIIVVNLPVAYILLKFGFAPYSVILFFIFTELICCCTRIFFAHKLVNLKPKTYINDVIIKSILPFCFALFVSYINTTYMTTSFIRLLINCIITSFILVLFIWSLGLTKNEKDIIRTMIISIKTKIINLSLKK